jgi:tocopherol O-methyltransferase
VGKNEFGVPIRRGATDRRELAFRVIVPPKTPDAAAVASHYDDLDLVYREVWGEHVHHGVWERGDETSDEAVLRLVEMVAERAKLSPGDHVCDAGCGYGASARILAEEHLARVTGFTLSERQFQYARAVSSGSANPDYRLCDWFENGLPDGSADAVISIESTEHMDKERFVAEAWRVLKPGGRLVICAWLAAEEPRSWELRHLLEPICREGSLPDLASETDFRRWISARGFDLERFDDLSGNVSRTWSLCMTRFARGLLHKPRYWRVLRESARRNRAFGLSLPRIWIAYRTGAMRYGIFTAVKSDAADVHALL